MPSPPPHFLGPGAVVATLVVVAVGVGSAVSALSALSIALLLSLAVPYCLLGTVGLHVAERRARRHAVHVILVAMVALGLGMIWITGESNAILAVMPAISVTVLYTSTAWASVATLLCAACFAYRGVSLYLPTQVVASGVGGFVAAAVFVIAFSRRVVGEHRMRADVERLAQELRTANDQLREYALRVQDLATTEERNRIAREIHDGLGHSLTVVHVQLEAARAIAAQDPERALACVVRAQESAQAGLADVRRAVAVLRDEPGETRPLPEVVARLVEECRACGIDARLRVEGAEQPLPPQVHATLFRAAQEALTNVRRHAGASRATLSLAYRAEEVELVVEDDGVGAQTTGGGFGLLGMRERVQLLGGTLATRTQVGEGFAVEVRVPL